MPLSLQLTIPNLFWPPFASSATSFLSLFSSASSSAIMISLYFAGINQAQLMPSGLSQLIDKFECRH